MNELEEALHRARAELEVTNLAIKTARGEVVEVLGAQLASLQAETTKVDAQVEAQEAELQALREQEQRALAALTQT